MESLTIHPKDKEQTRAVKAILKVLKIPFETEQEYDPEFVAKIKESENEIRNGKYTRITNENELDEILGLNDEI